VVINLGTNDFAKGDPGGAFVTRYRELVDEVRLRYDDAEIFCALGPMLSGSALAAARSYITGIVDAVRDDGDGRIHFLEFGALAGGEEYACDYHPSLSAHQRLADELIAALEGAMGWTAQ
jgi:hypothetical protein